MDPLQNTVRPYAWGSTTAIPQLLGVPPTGEPQAEMWLGGHPGAPSLIDRGAGPSPLPGWIEADPVRELGPESVRAYGAKLPFLLKLLAAGSPLSLQVHPDPEQAREGFAREEAAGVPVDAPERNYKDEGHKPELICALTPFDGLCGFRHPSEAADLLAGLDVDGLKPYVDILRANPEGGALREVLTGVLTADREEIAETVGQAAVAASALAADADGAYSGPYATCASLAQAYPGDPGVIAAMLLHHVRLQPGEALYLGAGVPHAYLSGLGVEIMASSDNVLRCGLTPKHIDVPELLRIVRFEPSDPGILRPEAGPDGEELYETPVGEFRLSRYVLAPGGSVPELGSRAPQILLCTSGRAVLHGERDGGEEELALVPGGSAYVPAGERVRLSGDGTLFRATVAV
ncbi:mannose-6-phosphate isomerase, class I [Streptomyces sp. HNM0574]|uniref:mannose-6-phosphate isomerase, class I n=1 Tax=Streptomyces sp. HNM0574 TaxID=2714954 RepID=UPI00146F8573|nr:mannose-6-phosphate isomerase, class I [Streptomyces sp. HNM0574]NLU70775.1 mannose-6-phosphate isomerase, class I [Streptomyces sp. HNM0574]